MVTFERINQKPSYCIFNDIKKIDLNLLSINKKCIKNTDVVYVMYFVYAHEIKYIITQNIDNQNIDNELPLCLSFNDIDAYIIEENKNKYLIFALAKNNRKLLQMCKKLWSEVKKQIECYSTESIKYEKPPMKIRFDSYDDDLPLNKIIWFSDLNIILESVFQIKDKYHPQIYIHECECEEYEY